MLRDMDKIVDESMDIKRRAEALLRYAIENEQFTKSSQEADDSDKPVNKCESLCIKG
jgi:hypothetical protein